MTLTNLYLSRHDVTSKVTAILKIVEMKTTQLPNNVLKGNLPLTNIAKNYKVYAVNRSRGESKKDLSASLLIYT